MRKYLIIAVAAVTAIAFSAVAFAQAGPDTATLKVSVSPAKAGTKKKPKNVKYKLDIVNNNTVRTMSDLDVFLAKNVKLNLKGMPKCAPDVIFARGCKKSAALGTGEAKAKVGVNGPAANVRDLIFKVTAYKTNSPVTGKEMLGFFIDDGASLQFLTETTLTKASGKYGQRLHIEVPELAQKVGTPPNATYNGLVSLNTTLNKKVGKKMLVSTTGCTKKKHPYKVDLTFIDNGVSTAKTISDSYNTKCKK